MTNTKETKQIRTFSSALFNAPNISTHFWFFFFCISKPWAQDQIKFYAYIPFRWCLFAFKYFYALSCLSGSSSKDRKSNDQRSKDWISKDKKTKDQRYQKTEYQKTKDIKEWRYQQTNCQKTNCQQTNSKKTKCQKTNSKKTDI